MQHFSKKITMGLIFLLLLIIGILFFIKSKSNIESNTKIIGLYNLLPSEEKVLSSFAEENEYSVLVLDKELPLVDAIGKKKIDILFSHDGANVRDVINKSDKKIKGISNDILQMMNSSVREVCYKNEKGNILALPILMDMFEIDIDKTVLQKTGISKIESWTDINKFALLAKKYSSYPILFYSKDSNLFLGTIASLIESREGKDVEKEIADILISSNGDKKLYDSAIEKMENTLISISEWKKEGLIHPQFSSFIKEDVQAFMEAKDAPIVFTTLSMHRTIPVNTINRYASIYYPSIEGASQRSFCAAMTLAIPMNDSENTVNMMDKIIENIDDFAFATGLAPTLASCPTADSQANYVRYWIASSNKPFPDLGTDAFTKQSDIDSFAESVKNKILSYR